MSSETYPVYVDEQQREQVKYQVAEEDETIKTINQRHIIHGTELELYKVPANEDPVESVLDQIDNDRLREYLEDN